MIFDPDDFRNDPYTAGLNQMGHVAFGAALMSFACLYMQEVWAAWIVGGGILVWELWQLKKRGASKRDYGMDLLFWWSGVAMWSSDWLTMFAVLVGGAWMFITWCRK